MKNLRRRMLFIKSHLEILELQNTKGKIKNKVD